MSFYFLYVLPFLCLLLEILFFQVAEFYEEMTKVESLNPLRTLHNAVPLKKMDKFFDKVTGQNIKARFPPVPWPSRSISREGNVTDLLTEAIKKLHS